MKNKIINLINLSISEEAMFLLYDFILNDLPPADKYIRQFDKEIKIDDTLALKAEVIDLIVKCDNDFQLDFICRMLEK